MHGNKKENETKFGIITIPVMSWWEHDSSVYYTDVPLNITDCEPDSILHAMGPNKKMSHFKNMYICQS